jgi:hypothetical protein
MVGIARGRDVEARGLDIYRPIRARGTVHVERIGTHHQANGW